VNPSELQQFRQKLLKQKDRLISEINGINDEGLNESLRDSISELSTYDNHPIDVATETFERSKDFALRDNARVILNNVEKAIQKINSGDYGYCEKCGKPIPNERLEAIPYAQLCIQCKNEEAASDPNRRPLEEDVLKYPFGRTFTDNTDYIGYDGEDAWQDVAKYGTSNSPQDVPGSVSYNDVFIDSDEPIGMVEEIDGLLDDEDNDDDNKNIIYK
jgi:YteA family regulatory protein